MRRRNFIEKSALISGGMTILPAVVLSASNTDLNISSLHCTDHIRHGYYGSDFAYSNIGNGGVDQIRIDRFRNPEGDMLLIEVKHGNCRINLARLENSVLIRTSASSFEIDLNELTLLTLDEESRIAIAKPGHIPVSLEDKAVVVIPHPGKEVRVMPLSVITEDEEGIFLFID